MIAIRQIYYDKNQKSLLEEGAIPFLNDGKVAAAEREFGVMKACYQEKLLFKDSTEYEGFISWKFSEKARIPLKSFISAIHDNPGYDVYILNPFPHQVLHRNVWHNGEYHHPGLLQMSQELVDRLGLGWELSRSPNIVKNVSYCNFWVGNQKFWDLYMSYGVALYNEVTSNELLREQFFKAAPGGNVGAPYFAFFFERLITEVLNRHPEIKVKSFRYAGEWLIQNFRKDVATFLSEIPFNQDLYGRENLEKVHFYYKALVSEPDFYNGEYYGNAFMGFIKRQYFLKKLLRNNLTIGLYRTLLKKHVKDLDAQKKGILS